MAICRFIGMTNKTFCLQYRTGGMALFRALCGTLEPAMNSHFCEQPTSYGRPLGHSQNDILYTNVPPMSSYRHLQATIPVSQGWLLIAGSTV